MFCGPTGLGSPQRALHSRRRGEQYPPNTLAQKCPTGTGVPPNALWETWWPREGFCGPALPLEKKPGRPETEPQRGRAVGGTACRSSPSCFNWPSEQVPCHTPGPGPLPPPRHGPAPGQAPGRCPGKHAGSVRAWRLCPTQRSGSVDVNVSFPSDTLKLGPAARLSRHLSPSSSPRVRDKSV